jgi:hypothetical protein
MLIAPELFFAGLGFAFFAGTCFKSFKSFGDRFCLLRFGWLINKLSKCDARIGFKAVP